MTGGSPPWSPEHEQLCRQMAANRASGSQIAMALGKTLGAVAGHCRRNGIQLRSRPPTGGWKFRRPKKPVQPPKPRLRSRSAPSRPHARQNRRERLSNAAGGRPARL